MSIVEPIDSNLNQNLEHNEESDEMTELVNALTSSWKFNDKENDQKQQQTPNISKKWYDGVVMRPVTFRSANNRSNKLK